MLDAEGAGPPLHGALADNFTLLDEATPAPQARLSDMAGKEVTLSDFQGRVVLLNFWATWCAPCIREMPSLDRLQAELGDEGLFVMAVSGDRGGARQVEPFLERLALKHLRVFLDPKGSFSREFGVRGLPTSLVIDRKGRIVGGIEGPLEWDGPEAKALLSYYLKQDAPAPGQDSARREATPNSS